MEREIKFVYNAYKRVYFMSFSWGRDCEELNKLQYFANKITNQYNDDNLWYWEDNIDNMVYTPVDRALYFDELYQPTQYAINQVKGFDEELFKIAEQMKQMHRKISDCVDNESLSLILKQIEECFMMAASSYKISTLRRVLE